MPSLIDKSINLIKIQQGHCHLPTQFWEAVSKKHAKISSRILKQVPSNNVALLLCPNQTLIAVDAIFKKSTLFQSESY